MRIALIVLTWFSTLCSVAYADEDLQIDCGPISEIRYECALDGLPSGRTATFRVLTECDHHRDFRAQPTNPNLYADGFRLRPKSRFVLRAPTIRRQDLDGDGAPDAAPYADLDVEVRANRTRIFFANRSPYRVDVGYTMRCSS